MGFYHCKELVSTLYPSSFDQFNRIGENSKGVLKRMDSLKYEDFKLLVEHLTNLIPTYMLEGLASSGDSFIDKSGLDRMIANLEKIHLIRIVPHELSKNVIEKQGMFFVSGCPDNYYDFSQYDTVTLDFLTELGFFMMQLTDSTLEEFTLRTKWQLFEKGIGFNDGLVRDGLEFVKRSVAEKNAMSVFLDMKNMKRSPFLFSSEEFTSIFAKALDFIYDANCSDGYAMGKLSESIFRGDFLDNLKEEINKRPKEIIAMLSILGKIYNAVYGDGKNSGEVLNYYTMLQIVLSDINNQRGNIPYTYN